MTTAAPTTTGFGFQLEFLDQEHLVIRQQQITEADFGHAIRHTWFDAFRQGLVPEYHPLATGARIDPVFPNDGGSSPRAQGFRVTVPLPGERTHRSEFDISYFRSSANRVRAELLRTEAMTNDQELYYRLNAFLDDAHPELPANKLAISLRPMARGISIAAGCRRNFGPGEPWDDPLGADVPVLVESAVLDEALDEARENPEREVGGFLLGHLLRDESREEVFVAVTGLASARGTTESSGTSVTFTPASFVQVRGMINLRGAGESVVGWYHSHPFQFCAECPLPTPPECVAKVLFYSTDDIHLMETTFEQPFMVGLLAAVEPRIEQAIGHLPVKLYGWRGGEIQERGFEVVRAANH